MHEKHIAKLTSAGKLLKGSNMDDLLEALTILRKYGNPAFPTHCEHDVLYVVVPADNVSTEDLQHLEELGFTVNEDDEGFVSYKFGSC